MKLTELQIQMNNAAKLIARKIEEAIENGAKIERTSFGAIVVDGVMLSKDLNDMSRIYLPLESHAISELLMPTPVELEEQREKLQRQLEDINEKLAKK